MTDQRDELRRKAELIIDQSYDEFAGVLDIAWGSEQILKLLAQSHTDLVEKIREAMESKRDNREDNKFVGTGVSAIDYELGRKDGNNGLLNDLLQLPILKVANSRGLN